MDGDVAALVRELKDRQEIYDCIVRYCQGIDRLDRERLLSAYHPDAVDDHGMFVGPATGFADWVFNFHGTYQHRTQHHITNHRCEIEGNVAHTESYYLFRSLNKQPPLYMTASGRYIDRFEKRDGRWAIAERICLVDIRDDAYAQTGPDADGDYVTTSRSKSDPSYLRPVKVDRSRFTK
jgi:hypothetical protein